jgi:hypothetical protein
VSGGSFDYLFLMADDAAELAKQRDRGNLAAIAKLMEGMTDGKLAARHTRAVIDLLAAAERLGVQLRDVWHDVEWWQSADYGPAQVRDALTAYNDQHGGEGDRHLSALAAQEGSTS